MTKAIPTERGEKMRRWADRLREEYDHVSFTYRVKLRRPIVAVGDLGKRWGTWDPFTRTMSLSVALLESYSWEAVVEVLKHEMAHQLVDEEWGGDEAHGPLFSKACDRLGVAPWAKRAVVEIGEPLLPGPDRTEAPEDVRLLRRVEKLLALAGSSNENEALSAMRKVREMYGKYNVQRIEEKRNEPHFSLYVRTGVRRVERFQYLICSILSEHFFVEVVHTELFDAGTCEPYKAAELLGTRENVLMAEYVYEFLMRQSQSLWDRHKNNAEPGKTRRRKRSTRTSFLAGVIAGFREKLQRPAPIAPEEPEAEGNGVALVVPPDPRLREYLGFRHPRLVQIRSGGSLGDRSAYERGKSEGRAIVLHKPVTGKGGFGGFLR